VLYEERGVGMERKKEKRRCEKKKETGIM